MDYIEQKKNYWENLKIKREEHGFTVQQVFEQTRVPIKYILAFESGNFEDIDPRTNIYPFLSTYCKFIGVDPNVYYDLYLEWVRINKNRFAKDYRAQKTIGIDIGSNIRLPAWLDHLFTWGIVCVILLLMWILYSFITYPVKNDPSNKVNAGTREAPIVHFQDEY